LNWAAPMGARPGTVMLRSATTECLREYHDID
jgi:hypothetical protein